MRCRALVLLVGALTLAACGDSNERSDAALAESVVEIDGTSADGVVREAAGDAQIINGCVIEANTQCPGADPSGADLLRADLRGANLERANLTGARLLSSSVAAVILGDADLSGADLEFAQMVGANLRGANLRRADLRGANLERADLTGARLWDANLGGANVKGADFSGTKWCRTTSETGRVLGNCDS